MRQHHDENQTHKEQPHLENKDKPVFTRGVFEISDDFEKL
jgi:hypothetical protein